MGNHEPYALACPTCSVQAVLVRRDFRCASCDGCLSYFIVDWFTEETAIGERLETGEYLFKVTDRIILERVR